MGHEQRTAVPRRRDDGSVEHVPERKPAIRCVG
jgi:hypothetical protein